MFVILTVFALADFLLGGMVILFCTKQSVTSDTSIPLMSSFQSRLRRHISFTIFHNGERNMLISDLIHACCLVSVIIYHECSEVAC